MLANRMGGFLRQRPQLMERMRNLRGMRGMGRNMMMPGLGIGSLPNMPSRDVNDLPLPDRASDIMPRDGMMPKQPPQLGMATQMAGVPPRGSGLPPMPNPMMDMQGRRFMKDGGGVDPNPGITALRKEAPEVVERMGYRGGGGVVLEEQKMVDNDADMMNYQRALLNYQKFYYSQPELLRANLPHPDEMYNDQSDRTISRKDRMLASGLAPASSALAPLGGISKGIMGLGRTLGDQDKEIIKVVLRDQTVTD